MVKVKAEQHKHRLICRIPKTIKHSQLYQLTLPRAPFPNNDYIYIQWAHIWMKKRLSLLRTWTYLLKIYWNKWYGTVVDVDRYLFYNRCAILHILFTLSQQSRFADMGNSILGRMDDMGTRMDELEQSIASLLQHAGLDQNGYSNNSSMNTISSLPIQSKPTYQQSPTIVQQPMKANGNSNKSTSPVHVVTSTTSATSTSIQPPSSNVIESNLKTSEIQSVTSPPQDRSQTSTRTRVTIEI
jgi:hypothetical protein